MGYDYVTGWVAFACYVAGLVLLVEIWRWKGGPIALRIVCGAAVLVATCIIKALRFP